MPQTLVPRKSQSTQRHRNRISVAIKSNLSDLASASVNKADYSAVTGLVESPIYAYTPSTEAPIKTPRPLTRRQPKNHHADDDKCIPKPFSVHERQEPPGDECGEHYACRCSKWVGSSSHAYRHHH
jgi:hypothetical protein